MVAVAILGILTAIALPKIQNAMARGNQLSAKNELTEVYIVEKNFRQLYKTFHWDWPMMGFLPKGLSPTVYSNALLGSKRRYTLYGGAGALGTVVTPAATLGLVATGVGFFQPSWGYGADPSVCRLAANGSRYDMIQALNGTFVPEIYKTLFTIGAMGCPSENVGDAAGIAAQVTSALANLDLITIDQNAVIRVLRSKYP